MIRTNLATQPFYNDGAVRFWVAAAVVLLAIASLLNATAVFRYSRSDTALATQASADERRASELRAAAAELRASVDTKQIAAAAVQARQANDLIDRRTFSWTELLNRFEDTLPEDVRITSVRPSQSRDRGVLLSITIVSRSVDDIERFMDSLESTGAFTDPLPTQDRVNEDGEVEAALTVAYRPMPRGGDSR